MWRWLYVLLNCLIIGQLAHCTRFNISYEEIGRCKEYDAVSGYGYSTYFKLDDMHNKLPTDHINIKLYILAAKDAHILLSSTDAPNATSPLYEIVLGAGGNTFAEIRRRRQSNPLKTTRPRKLLSPIEPIPIHIHVENVGGSSLIEVLVPGSNVLNLTAVDPAPFTIQYISFCSWGNTEAKFFYDCHEEDDSKSDHAAGATDETHLTIKLTPQQHLRTSLFSSDDMLFMPADLTNVRLTMQFLTVSYDYRRSTLTTRAILRANWTDPRLAWNPQNYSDIQALQLSEEAHIDASTQLWQPSFRLINGKDAYFKRIQVNPSITIHASGEVSTESRTMIFDTWCPATDSNWPNDVVSCDISIGLQQQLELVPLSIDFNKLNRKPQSDGEWHLISYGSPATTTASNETIDRSMSINYKIELQRNVNFYKDIVAAPLYTAIGLLNMSLLASGYLRVTFNLLSIIIVQVMMLFFAEHAPIAFVPNSVILFEYVLIAAVLTFILFIINCWLRENNDIDEKFGRFIKIIEMPWVRVVLFLDSWEMRDITGYEKVAETTEALFSSFLDRLAFIALFITSILITYAYHI